jgi:hypothetical protein
MKSGPELHLGYDMKSKPAEPQHSDSIEYEYRPKKHCDRTSVLWILHNRIHRENPYDESEQADCDEKQASSLWVVSCCPQYDGNQNHRRYHWSRSTANHTGNEIESCWKFDSTSIDLSFIIEINNDHWSIVCVCMCAPTINYKWSRPNLAWHKLQYTKSDERGQQRHGFFDVNMARVHDHVQDIPPWQEISCRWNQNHRSWGKQWVASVEIRKQWTNCFTLPGRVSVRMPPNSSIFNWNINWIRSLG